MEIQIQCIDGETSNFTMSHEGLCLDLLESLKPTEFFNQPLLRLQAGKRTSIFVMNAVESIYFTTEIHPKIKEQPPAKEFHSILKSEYMQELEMLRSVYESATDLFEAGSRIDTVLALRCASGREFFLKAEVLVGHRLEQIADMHGRLERLTSVIPCGTRGYLAINPHNIRKIEIYPAPPLPIRSGWQVD